MSAISAEPSVGSLYGTPVLFYPVPTPWPLSAGCEDYIHRQSNERLFLAWDPVYPEFGSGAETCYRPEQRGWWSQAAAQTPSVALGPTFVCPEAYSAVFSTVLESNSAAQTQFTYCCPPEFKLGTLRPPEERSVRQCMSTAGPGKTISYLSISVVLTSTETAVGDDGTATRLTSKKTTNLPTSTVVDSDSVVTVFAPPVNGYNLVARQTSTSASGTDAGVASNSNSNSNTATTPPPPPGTSNDASTQPGETTPSAGTIAGAVIGGVLGLGLLVLGAYFVRKRYRYGGPGGRSGSDMAAWDGGTVGGDYGSSHYSPPQYGSPQYGHLHGPAVVSEMSGDGRPYEMPSGLYAHELPGVK